MDYTALNTQILGIPAEASPTLLAILGVIGTFAVVSLIARYLRKI